VAANFERNAKVASQCADVRARRTVNDYVEVDEVLLANRFAAHFT
jgi:hypothetical protein